MRVWMEIRLRWHLLDLWGDMGVGMFLFIFKGSGLFGGRGLKTAGEERKNSVISEKLLLVFY
jgi:hypothetical protein